MASRPRVTSAKRDAIVRAATTLFSRYGFRKASIELIAKEAGVAKPTVYTQFEDKEALFAAVCEGIVQRILSDARAAASRDAPLVERVTAVLSAKFTTVFELVDSSPHARELLDSQAAGARRLVEAADREFLELLTDVIDNAVGAKQLDVRRLGTSPAALARLLMQVGHGAGYRATSLRTHRSNLRSLVALALQAGLRS